MDGIVAVLVALGPLAVILIALTRTIRRRLGYGAKTPPIQWPGRGSGPWTAGDRSPTRPRVPTLSGGAALPVPRDDLGVDDASSAGIIPAGRVDEQRAAG